MEDAFSHLIRDEPGLLIPILAIVFGCGIAIIAIIMQGFTRMSVGSDIEKSRRELAAYVAEGAMTPDDARKLLDAGPRAASKKCKL